MKALMKNITNVLVQLLPIKAWNLNQVFMSCIWLIPLIPKRKTSKAQAGQPLLPFWMNISVPHSSGRDLCPTECSVLQPSTDKKENKQAIFILMSTPEESPSSEHTRTNISWMEWSTVLDDLVY